MRQFLGWSWIMLCIWSGLPPPPPTIHRFLITIHNVLKIIKPRWPGKIVNGNPVTFYPRGIDTFFVLALFPAGKSRCTGARLETVIITKPVFNSSESFEIFHIQ